MTEDQKIMGLYLARVIHGSLALFLKVWREGVGIDDLVYDTLMKAKEAVWEFKSNN